jgi:DNA-binding response OmpR family regulator
MESRPSTQAGEAARGNGEIILVVDDDPTVHEFLFCALEDAGYRVLQAFDGRDGLEVFDDYSSSIDLVILDLHMPRLNGVETCRRLRQRSEVLPVILSSSSDFDRTAGNAAGPGFSARLPKPYTIGALLGTVRRVLDTSASGQDLAIAV